MNLCDSDDEVLIASCQDDNEEAFGVLYSRYFDTIKSILMAKTGVDEHDANDIVQKSFIKAMRRIKSFKGNASFKTWIFRIAYNTFLDSVRKGKGEYSLEALSVSEYGVKTIPEATTNENPASSYEEDDRVSLLSKQLAEVKEKLSESQQQIYDLIFVQNLSYKDAADIMGCPIGTVMSRVHFTRKRLKRLLEQKKDLAVT